MPSFLTKYELKNAKNFNNIFPSFNYRFENTNNLFYFFVQRNMKAGCKLKNCKIVFNILRLIERYSQYFYYKKNKNSKFKSSFNYNLYFIKRYFKFLPNFTLRLENEYKGKHKTKRKFMYPVFLEDKKSQINELSL